MKHRLIDDDFCCSLNSEVYLHKGFQTVALQCLITAVHQHIVFTRDVIFLPSVVSEACLCVLGIHSKSQGFSQGSSTVNRGMYRVLGVCVLI